MYLIIIIITFVSIARTDRMRESRGRSLVRATQHAVLDRNSKENILNGIRKKCVINLPAHAEAEAKAWMCNRSTFDSGLQIASKCIGIACELNKGS
jgi:hypothetical protein